MTGTTRTPPWIQIAAATLVAQHLVVFVVHPIAVLSAASLAVTIIVAVFLLRGSRFAWVLSVVSAAALLISPFTMSQPAWFFVAGAVLFVCLLLPASRGFIWTSRERREDEGGSSRSDAKRYESFTAVIYRLLGRVLWMGGQSKVTEGVGTVSRRKVIVRLVIFVVVCYPLIGLFYKFHHGPASGSVFIDVLWEVTWRFFTLAQLILVILLASEGYRYFIGRNGTAARSR